MSKQPMKPQLWTPRPVEETVQVYRDWADTYDADVAERGYQTPARLAALMKDHIPLDAVILDFGCGTGVSGAALRQAGYKTIDGTDITDAMLDVAGPKGIYRSLWLGTPGATPADPGTYHAILAAGVISLGAAPPETLGSLIEATSPGAFIALSFNDPTLEDGSYDAYLDSQVTEGLVEIVARTHGPHLADLEMGSDVILLKRL